MRFSFCQLDFFREKKIINYIDSHVHLDHVFSDNPERIQWLEQTGGVPVSWSFCKPVKIVADIRTCLLNHANIIRNLSDSGFVCYFLAGIHPRNISPDLKPKHIREMILPYLDDPLCLGIGEIGLETGSQREKEMLLAHLDLAGEVAERGKVMGIHTPRSQKAAITEQTLDLLTPFSGFREIMVIDHCMPQTIGPVLAAGFWAGVTLSPVKASAGDMLAIINDHEPLLSRIMLNTDSGTLFYEDLYSFIRSAGVDEKIVRALTQSNAGHFFRFENAG